jgi:hypothetical protein
MTDYFKTFENFKQDKQDSDYTIFCDMDGVLTNFVKRFQELETNPKSLTPEQYTKENGLHSIWGPIDTGGIDWWANMEWMPDGPKLWSWLQPYRPTILSAPSRNPDSRNGKMAWLKSNLHIKQNFFTVNPRKWKPHYKIIFNSQKHEFVRNEFDILIDDTPKKVQNWRAAGGTAILHTSTNKTIAELKKLLY